MNKKTIDDIQVKRVRKFWFAVTLMFPLRTARLRTRPE